MLCFYCKGGMEENFTTHFTEINGGIIIIKEVPCSKCTQCGELVYTGTTMKEIEKIVSKVQNSITEIAVTTYQQTV